MSAAIPELDVTTGELAEWIRSAFPGTAQHPHHGHLSDAQGRAAYACTLVVGPDHETGITFTLASATAGFADSGLEQAALHDFWYCIAYEGILALHDVKREPITVPLTGAIDAPTYRVHFAHVHPDTFPIKTLHCLFIQDSDTAQ